jgi:hypothetical protein
MASVGAQAFGGAPGKCDCGRDRTESWRLKAIQEDERASDGNFHVGFVAQSE